MPTYEYKCPKGHVFEKTVPRITSQRFAKCPQCGKRAERQISGGAGLVFKGSGFYATDYKRPAGTTEKADNTAEKAEKAGKAETPTDSKPKKKDSSSDK
jgi:putative FmdB family regulatory protein